VEDIDFLMDFVVGNSNNLQNLVWKEKLLEPFKCLHIAESINFLL
jgi:hypothetical protein